MTSLGELALRFLRLAASTWHPRIDGCGQMQLGRAALIDVLALLIATTAAFLLVRYKVNATWLILGGAAAGWLVHSAVPLLDG